MATALSPAGAEGDLPPPFFNVGPVEWKCHGLQARLANSTKHGSRRYWVMYCPSDGMSLGKMWGVTILDPSIIAPLRRAYTVLKRIHGDKVVPGITLPQHWHDSPPAMLSEYHNNHPVVPGSSEVIGSIERFLDFAIQLSTRLCEVHTKKVRHGAIRPESVSISPTGQVWLHDFTCASFLFKGERTAEMRMESDFLPYLPPECTGRINRRVDYRSDFYSLGATFYHIITGQRLWASSIDAELDITHKHVTQSPPATNFHPAVDAVIAKLLAKMPEHRYQTCEGLLSDWKDIQQNPDALFTVGKADQASRFMLPQGLYGRATEMELLRDLYLRAHEEKWSDLVFLKGHAGVGKTALVKELSGIIQSTRTIFCEGKFDQSQSTPFSAIRQALGGLTRQILAEPATRLSQWRNSILSTLNGEIAVLLPLIPDVAHILAVELPPPFANLEDPTSQVERQKRVLIQFLRVFAERKTLVMFLDDLQWSSQSDLQLLASLVQEFPLQRSGCNSTFSGSLNSTLLICAYRDSGVGPTHPVRVIFENCVPSHTIQINPLSQEDTARFVCDTLYRPLDQCEELTRVLISRTRGNPFFIQRVCVPANRVNRRCSCK